MDTLPARDSRAAMLALESAAAATRAGFACCFSTAAEYESALVTARRAAGRYRRPSRWPHVMLCAGVVLMAAFALSAIALR